MPDTGLNQTIFLVGFGTFAIFDIYNNLVTKSRYFCDLCRSADDHKSTNYGRDLYTSMHVCDRSDPIVDLRT